jgi:hypothetical protein
MNANGTRKSASERSLFGPDYQVEQWLFSPAFGRFCLRRCAGGFPGKFDGGGGHFVRQFHDVVQPAEREQECPLAA